MKVSIEGKIKAYQVLNYATEQGRLTFEEDKILRSVIVSEYHKDCDAALEAFANLTFKATYSQKYEQAMQCAVDFRDIVLDELQISAKTLSRRLSGKVKFRADEVDRILKRCGYENLI